MDYNIYDIYTDASIDLDKKLGCAGAIVVDRKINSIIDVSYAVKAEATNNLCEVIALWLGVNKAISLLYEEREPFKVNIFSDSQISLFGARDWIFNWIINRKGNNLLGSNGSVSNQEWFKAIYCDIISSKIKLRFFHQKGHVSERSNASLYHSEKVFRNSNGLSCDDIGVTPVDLSRYNNYVDRTSRDIVFKVLSGADPDTIPFTFLINQDPIEYVVDSVDIPTYKDCISGGFNLLKENIYGQI